MSTLSSFKLFVVEDKEHGSGLDRVLNAIEKRLPALLNTKLYRFGGKDGTEQLKSGVGYLYFFGKGKAFRIRTKGSTIIAFDVWTKYGMNATADYTIHTENLSVAAIASELKKIAQLIKSPKEGKVEITAVEEAKSISLEIGADLFEAKGVSPEEFLKLAKKDLSDAQVKDVTFDQIVKIARDNNVGVPSKKYLDGQKVGRGRWSLIPGGSSEKESKSDEPNKPDSKSSGKAEPILYIKVTAQDPVTKRFISAGENKQAQALYNQIQDKLAANPTEEEMRDVDMLYGHLFQLVTLACKDKLKALLIYGGPGTGKTFTIMEAIKAAGLVKGEDYVKLSGKITPTELYKTLFMFRKGGLILFDDCDSMWKNQDAANYLKAALDTSPVREISSANAQTKNVSKWTDDEREKYNTSMDHYLAGTQPDEEDETEEEEEGDSKRDTGLEDKMKFPSTFEFRGRVVFVSNLKKEEFDKAILSRSAKIDMSLTPEETLVRIRSILPTLGGTDVSIEDKEKLIGVLLDLNKKKILDVVTIREFVKGLDIVRSGAENWQELVIYM